VRRLSLEIEKQGFKVTKEEQTLLTKLRALRSNFKFIRFALSLSGLYFVVSGI